MRWREEILTKEILSVPFLTPSLSWGKKKKRVEVPREIWYRGTLLHSKSIHISVMTLSGNKKNVMGA